MVLMVSTPFLSDFERMADIGPSFKEFSQTGNDEAGEGFSEAAHSKVEAVGGAGEMRVTA
jgi:hypothetical protein